METYKLEGGQLMRIEGPAKVLVRSGRIYAVGNIYTVGKTFTVLRARKLVIKALEDSVIEITLGDNANIEPATPEEEVIDVWEESIGKLRLDNSLILIYGAMDVGKSTLTVLIANKALNDGRSVAVIDADVGQNDVGPPTTIALTRIKSPITHLRQLSAEKLIFIQTTSVERIWDRVIKAIHKLVNYARESWNIDTIIVNTDGWISGDEAVRYKAQMVEELAPTHVVVLRREDETNRLIEELKTESVIVLPAPFSARVRSREDRKIHRDMGYGRFLFPIREVSLDLHKVKIANLPVLWGNEVKDEFKALLSRMVRTRIYHAYQYRDRIYAVAGTSQWTIKRIPNGFLYILPEEWETGLLVGLEDAEGFLVGLGMLKKIYYDRGKAIVIISEKLEQKMRAVKAMRIGFIRLNDKYEEAEKVYNLIRYEV